MKGDSPKTYVAEDQRVQACQLWQRRMWTSSLQTQRSGNPGKRVVAQVTLWVQGSRSRAHSPET